MLRYVKHIVQSFEYAGLLGLALPSVKKTSGYPSGHLADIQIQAWVLSWHPDTCLNTQQMSKHV